MIRRLRGKTTFLRGEKKANRLLIFDMLALQSSCYGNSQWHLRKMLMASCRQDEQGACQLHPAICSLGQSPVSRIDWCRQSHSRGCWLHQPHAPAAARSPSRAAEREPSSSSSSCSGGDGGGCKERLLSGSDRWRKNQLGNKQLMKEACCLKFRLVKPTNQWVQLDLRSCTILKHSFEVHIVFECFHFMQLFTSTPSPI